MIRLVRVASQVSMTAREKERSMRTRAQTGEARKAPSGPVGVIRATTHEATKAKKETKTRCSSEEAFYNRLAFDFKVYKRTLVPDEFFALSASRCAHAEH